MKFAFAITGALASKDLLEDVTTLLSTAASEDDAVMLSVAAIRDSIQLAAEENRASSTNALNEMTRLQDPRKASELLQQFALNTVEAGQGLDEETRKTLIWVRDTLTNATYTALEQAHRQDQDLLNNHAKAINECGLLHMRHLQQDVEGLEVELVRDTERAMYKCRGLVHHDLSEDSWVVDESGDDDLAERVADLNEAQHQHLLRHRKSLQMFDLPPSELNEAQRQELEEALRADSPGLLQVAKSEPDESWRTNAVDEHGNYDPDKDPDATWAMKAVRAGPNHEQIKRGVWQSGDWTNQGHRFWSQWTGVNDPKYDDPLWSSTGSCAAANDDMFARCNALDVFVKTLPLPNCVPPVETDEMAVPTCDGGIVGVDSDLADWFTNMKANALFYQGQWQEMKKACDDARDYYSKICKECDTKQRQFETAFCSYRQGLHATCREYQGCHVLNEQQYNDLIKSVMYNADSRKIDWKAIHKIECYINVLISTKENEVRAKDLLNCEAGNLNTIETILTGFNETNYLSLIKPEINVSCWDLDLPQYIDFKECDMTSVQQHPCTEDWMARYNGLIAPAPCTECAPIPEEFQYHMEQEHNTPVRDDFGGGWYYVHEQGRTANEDDLTDLAVGGYHLPTYVTKNLRWNEVLIERMSTNWCDSWNKQTKYWAGEDGASMCIQSDEEHVYCMNNAHGGHSWRQQPASHFTVNCAQGKARRETGNWEHGDLAGKATKWERGSVEAWEPDCECWPKSADKNMCWAYNRSDASGPTLQNVPAPDWVNISSLTDDGKVVKISFQGEEKNGTLKVGNYNAFLQDASGCHAIGNVKYRVYVRCLGCSTEETEFHTKDGAQFLGQMRIGQMTQHKRSSYTYEAWFRSPLEGKYAREIFGGANSGLTLQNVNAVPCMHDAGSGMNSGHQKFGYQLHAGSTTKWSSVCFNPNTWYHVAVTKSHTGAVTVYVNGRNVTAEGHKMDTVNDESTLANTFGGGFQDSEGQLFNVRIWNHARTANELYQDAFVTRASAMSDMGGLAHWWPLTDDLKDLITQMPLQPVAEGAAVRYVPIWCSDLEASGMRGC